MFLFPVSDSSMREALQDEEMKTYDWDEWFEEYLTSPELFDLSEVSVKDPDKDIQIGTIVKYLKNADESTHHFNYQSIKKEELLLPGLTLPKIETLKEFKTEISDEKNFIKYDLDYHKQENYGHFTDDLWKTSLLDISDNNQVFTDLDPKPSHLIDIPSQNVNSPLYPSPPTTPSNGSPTSSQEPSATYTNLNPLSMSLHLQDFSNSNYDQFYSNPSTPLPSPFFPLHAHIPPSNTSLSSLISSSQTLLNLNSPHTCNPSISEKINLYEKSDVSSLQSSLQIQTADSTTNPNIINNTFVSPIHGSNLHGTSIQKHKDPCRKIKRLKKTLGTGCSGAGAGAAGKTHPDQGDGSLTIVKRPRGRPRKERSESIVVKPVKRMTIPSPKNNVAVKPRKRPEGNKSTHLWEYLLALLQDSELGSRWVRWVDEGEGVFEIRVGRSEDVARLWGKIKRNQTMTYDKMSRSLRWCKKYGSMLEVPEDKGYPKKRCFRFVHTNRDLTSMRQLLTAAKQNDFSSKNKRVEE